MDYCREFDALDADHILGSVGTAASHSERFKVGHQVATTAMSVALRLLIQKHESMESPFSSVFHCELCES